MEYYEASREKLIAALKIFLDGNNPCCSCCGGDSDFDSMVEDALEILNDKS